MTTENHRSPTGRRSPYRALLQERFIVLLVLLVTLLVTVPCIRLLKGEGPSTFGPVLLTTVFSVMLLTAVFAVSDRRRTVIIALSLALVSIILQGLHLSLEHYHLFLAQSSMVMIFLGYTIILVLKFLFTVKRVTVNVICASLCVYLLLGLVWSLAYSMLYAIDPSAFTLPASSTSAPSLRFGGEDSIVPVYFSYVTLTTLGYGDIAPISPLARSVTTLEAITGQVYLAVLVARLVGMHITQETAKESS